MDAKAAEEKVKRYTFFKTKIGYYNKKIQLIDCELQNIKSMSLEEIKGTGNGNKKEKLIDQKTLLEKQIKEMTLEAKFIEEAINLLDKIEKEILIDYYVHKLTINVIAQKQKYSECRIRQIKQKTLVKLGQFLD